MNFYGLHTFVTNFRGYKAGAANFFAFRMCGCDFCFLFADPLKEVHRSRCRTKNYCSQICRDADDAVHKVCCHPDKDLQKIDQRKVKIGGKDKVEAANAELDSLVEHWRSLPPALLNPADVKITEKAKSKKKVTKVGEVD